jgi:proteasome lid subunit RPN8/RPN11
MAVARSTKRRKGRGVTEVKEATLKPAEAELPPIDTSQVKTGALPEKPFPSGQIFRVYIADEPYKVMWKHARETLADGELINEVGGILVGDIFRDESGPYLEIKAAIIAEHTRNEGTEVAFTPETWVQINGVKDDLYPDERIVGWYHTHPRFGIFLSERDKFIHRHSFPQPWAAAFVIDPVQNLEGLFLWSDGEPREAEEYWAGRERKLRSTKNVEETTPSNQGEAREPGVSRTTYLSSLAIVVAALLFVSALFYRNELRHTQEMETVGRALNSQQQEIDRTLQNLAALQGYLDSAAQKDAVDKEQINGAVKQLQDGLRRVDSLAQTVRRDIAVLEGAARSNSGHAPVQAGGAGGEKKP